jgi:hypothetical protein
MQYSPYDPWRKYAPVFGALSLAGGGAGALSGIGTAISAANTLAGGGYAAEHGQMQQNLADFQANRDIENAASTTATAQRQAIATSQQANLARSSAVARAAAGGVNADTGSALVDQAQIASRGANQSNFDLWSGQNRATSLMNQAGAKQYSGYMDLLGGEEAQRSSDLSAASTIAGGGASILRNYGKAPPGG